MQLKRSLSLQGTDRIIRVRATAAWVVWMALAMSPVTGNADSIEPETPEETIQEMANNVLAYLEFDRENLEANRARLDAMVAEQILPHFEFRYASRLILGKHFKEATPEQRDAFADAFSSYLVRVYGHTVLRVNRETLTVLAPGTGTDTDKATVKTLIIMADGTEVPVDFRMARVDGYWKIWDVVARGVSYVRTYREDFGVVIASDGLDHLNTFLRTPK